MTGSTSTSALPVRKSEGICGNDRRIFFADSEDAPDPARADAWLSAPGRPAGRRIFAYPSGTDRPTADGTALSRPFSSSALVPGCAASLADKVNTLHGQGGLTFFRSLLSVSTRLVERHICPHKGKTYIVRHGHIRPRHIFVSRCRAGTPSPPTIVLAPLAGKWPSIIDQNMLISSDINSRFIHCIAFRQRIIVLKAPATCQELGHNEAVGRL